MKRGLNVQTVNYNIHGLVTLQVKGNRQLIQNVDLHLWAFKVKTESKYTSIKILPYADYRQEKNGLVTDDWVFTKNFAIRSTTKFAIGFRKGSLYMFADSLDIPINLLIQIMLLRRKCSFIHAAGFKTQNQSGIVLAAGPGAGKTSFTAVADKLGWATLGDDLCIVGNGKVWSYPQALSIYPYHMKIFNNFSWKIRNKLQLIRFFGKLGDLLSNKRSPYAKFLRVFINFFINKNLNLSTIEVLKNGSILESIDISKFIYMTRNFKNSKSTIRTFKSRDFSDIMTILWHEWHNSFHEILLIDSYLYSGRLLDSLFIETKRVFEKEFRLKKIIEINIPNILKSEELLGEFSGIIKRLNVN